ncbi:MAG: hypothetical protein ACUVRJ_06540, partial [Candidatus Villigracilaceae bacterium]
MGKDDGPGNIKIGGNVTHGIIVDGGKNVINLSPSSGSSGDKLLQTAVVLLIIVALILGACGLLFIFLRRPNLPLAITPTAASPTLEVETPAVMATATATEQSLAPSETSPLPSPGLEPVVSSPVPPADRMVAILQSNRIEGKAPFEARFDGRASYVYFADGRLLQCSQFFSCTYTFNFNVYLAMTSLLDGLRRIKDSRSR